MELFNSNFFAGLATLLTGTVAIGIYFQQKNDTKTQAARVLLVEIRTAEERIAQIKEKIATEETADIPSVLPTKSWKIYSHLFVSDLDQDELKLMGSFYDYCESIEDFGKRNNDFFWITTEERARVSQQQIAEIFNEAYAITEDNRDEFITNKIAFVRNAFDNYGFMYSPQKTLTGIKNYIDKIQTITTSTCGLKLKRIAKLSK